MPPYDAVSHDPRTGGRGYPGWTRDRFWSLIDEGRPTGQAAFPTGISRRSAFRWRRRYRLQGVIYRHAYGLGRRSPVVSEALQIMTLLYLIAYPDAPNAELCGFIVSLDPTLAGILRPYHVSRFTKKFRMSWKLIRSVARERDPVARNLFWRQPLPRGINGVHLSRLVDTDESAVYVTTCNRRRARTFVGQVYFLLCLLMMLSYEGLHSCVGGCGCPILC